MGMDKNLIVDQVTKHPNWTLTTSICYQIIQLVIVLYSLQFY